MAQQCYRQVRGWPITAPPRKTESTQHAEVLREVAMKSRRFRNFVEKASLLLHVRSRKYHPQTIRPEERYHGSLKLEQLYRALPNDRTELIKAVSSYRRFYNYERLHMRLGYRTPPTVYLTKGRPQTLTYQPEKLFQIQSFFIAVAMQTAIE